MKCISNCNGISFKVSSPEEAKEVEGLQAWVAEAGEEAEVVALDWKGSVALVQMVEREGQRGKG